VSAPANPERVLIGRIGAAARWAKEDPLDPDGPLPRARAAFDARFYAGIPEDLPTAERDRRAAHARIEYFARLALKSAQVRRARKAADDAC